MIFFNDAPMYKKYAILSFYDYKKITRGYNCAIKEFL